MGARDHRLTTTKGGYGIRALNDARTAGAKLGSPYHADGIPRLNGAHRNGGANGGLGLEVDRTCVARNNS